jgi:2-iminobutanoate/2-iminopropanoate deaminase
MRQILRTDRVHEPTTPSYSHAVRAGPWLCVAGQVARAPDGSIVGPGDIAAQTRQALDNIRALVEAGGGTLDDVVETIVYLTDMRHRDTVLDLLTAYFPAPAPASTLLQIVALANEAFLIEISARAYLAGAARAGS